MAPEKQPEKQKLINRLHRVQGQLRGLERLLGEDADCEAVLTQLTAAKAALEQLGIALISTNLKECAERAESDEHIDRMLRKYLRGALR